MQSINTYMKVVEEDARFVEDAERTQKEGHQEDMQQRAYTTLKTFCYDSLLDWNVRMLLA